MPLFPHKVPTPKELYDKLKEKYDWNVLFNTRPHWTFNHYECPIPYLSTFDLIDIYYDQYVPYFLNTEKKVA